MTTYYIESSNVIELYDAIPALGVTTGEGAAGCLRVVDDYAKIAATSSPITQAGGSIRMCRIPTNAKVKSVVLAETAILDTHDTDTLVFDLNMAFSDAPQFGQDDGTQPALGGQCPTTVGNATTVIDIAAAPGSLPQTDLGAYTTTTAPTYTNPNILFGQWTPVYTAITGLTEYLANGVNAQNTGANPTNGADVAGPLLMLEGGTMMPLYQIFGFSNNSKSLFQDPGGFFDLVLYVSTAATTAAAGYIYGKISYVV